MRHRYRVAIAGAVAVAGMGLAAVPASASGPTDVVAISTTIAQADSAAAQSYAAVQAPDVTCHPPVQVAAQVTPYVDYQLGTINQTDEATSEIVCATLSGVAFSVHVSSQIGWWDTSTSPPTWTADTACPAVITVGPPEQPEPAGVGVGFAVPPATTTCTVAPPDSMVARWRSLRTGLTVVENGVSYGYEPWYSTMFGGPAAVS